MVLVRILVWCWIGVFGGWGNGGGVAALFCEVKFTGVIGC